MGGFRAAQVIRLWEKSKIPQRKARFAAAANARAGCRSITSLECRRKMQRLTPGIIICKKLNIPFKPFEDVGENIWGGVRVLFNSLYPSTVSDKPDD